MALQQGKDVEAKEYYEQSIALAKEMDGPYRVITRSYVGLGFLAERRGDYVQAKQLFSQSLAFSGEIRYTLVW